MKVRETPSSKFSLGFGGGGVWGGEPGRVTVPPPPPNPCVCPPPPKSLPRKSFLGVFRSLPSLEKTVGKCLILLKPRASRLVVQLHCKYGVTKTHNLAFQECERLQAVFDTQRCASSLRAPARVLAEAVVHFPQTLAEVTLGAGPRGKISLQNYVEDEAGEPCGVGGGGALSLALGCQHGPPRPTSFPPREEQDDGDRAVSGRGRVPDGGCGPGLPHHLLPQGVSGATDLRRGLQLAPHHPLRRARQAGDLHPGRCRAGGPPGDGHPLRCGKQLAAPHGQRVSGVRVTFGEGASPSSALQLPSVGSRVNGPPRLSPSFLALSPTSVSHQPPPTDDFADDLESYMMAMETSAYEEGSGVPPSPTFPLRTPRPAESDPEEEEEEEEGAVPGTPPHKKVWDEQGRAWG
uniref:Uncharacterized protein n=1 Tax=Calidris pygmaea TaxID=425635 RepID=A0A8C3JHF3_9CHAR